MSTSRNNSPQPLSVNLSDPAEARAEVSRLKRCLAASQGELAQATNAKRKKPPTLTTKGRGIRKVITLFDNLSSIIEEADRRLMELSDESLDEVLEVPHEDKDIQRARDRAWAAYKLFSNTTPQLKSVLEDPDPASLNAFLSKLQEGANGARSDDIKRIKEDLAAWVNLEYKPVDLLDPKTRDGRGLQHDVCGRLLAPIQFDWQNLEVRANIRNGADNFSLSNKYFLACLYPIGQGNHQFVERNFLRSKLLLQVYCAIFTSPSSADGFEDHAVDGPVRKKQKTTGQKKATKSNIASILNMDGKVTGRSIAYAAVLLVFNLTNCTQWTDAFNGFNFSAFYNFLVDYFEEIRGEESTRRVKLLLAWWNRQVFPQHISTTLHSNESHDLLATQQNKNFDCILISHPRPDIAS